MSRIALILAATLILLEASAASRPRDEQPPELYLIPYPREVRPLPRPAVLPLRVGAALVGVQALPDGARFLLDELKANFGVTATVESRDRIKSRRPPARTITFLLCTSKREPGWAEATQWDIFPPRAGRPESYAFMAHRNALVVAARDERGFQCAAITILQLVKAHRNRRGEVDGIELPGVMVRDWPALRRRGLMLDPARLKERNEYYAAVVDFIGAYKANALFLHLTDDTGIALQFPSHPSLATPHAFSPDDIASLVARGRRLGLDVVPEIESLGHAGAITRNPKYRALSEAGSNCLNPCLPETARLLDDLYADCAGVFPAQLLHCGMDEVGALGRSEECRRAYGQDPDRDDASIQDWAYARHVIAVHDLLAKRGKRMVMWGDMILRHREVARRIPKDILIDDWHYGTTVSAASAEFFIASGFEVIGSPALMCGNYRLMPSAANLRNVDEFTRVAQRHGLSGLNVTVWVPQRYLADAAWLSIARSCAVMWEGVADAEGGFDERRFLRAYVRRRFGLTPDDEIIAALRTLQELVPTHQQFLVLLPPDADGLRRLLESAELPAATEGLARPLHDDTAGIVRTLETRRDEVRRNVEEFESLVLVARIERHLGAMLDLAVNETPVPLDADGRATLQRRLDENDSLLEALNASWDRWRYPDTPGRVGEPQSLRSHWLNRYFEDFGNAARALLKASGRP